MFATRSHHQVAELRKAFSVLPPPPQYSPGSSFTNRLLHPCCVKKTYPFSKQWRSPITARVVCSRQSSTQFLWGCLNLWWQAGGTKSAGSSRSQKKHQQTERTREDVCTTEGRCVCLWEEAPTDNCCWWAHLYHWHYTFKRTLTSFCMMNDAI